MEEKRLDIRRILLVKCRDRRGLIHGITGAISSQGLNITHNSEYVDRETSIFFMRSELEGVTDDLLLLDNLRAVLPPDSTLALKPVSAKRLVVFAAKEPHCLGDLLLRDAYRELPGKIHAVVSNHPSLRELVERFQIPFCHVSHEGRSREQHEHEILEIISGHEPDYLIMAKYMRILTSGFVARFPRQIINIHHSFLPAFVGAKPYLQAYQRGVKIIGATAHFINESLDEGPIIAQGIIPINHAYEAEDMAVAGREIEKQVLARALKLVLEERVFVHGNKTIIFDGE